MLLASKAAWQFARVNRSASLASASLHTLPRRPVTLQHEAKRVRVCHVQELQLIVLLVLVLVLHRGAVTVSSAGPRGLFKGMTTATSGVIARFPLLLPVRNSVASYGASAALALQYSVFTWTLTRRLNHIQVTVRSDRDSYTLLSLGSAGMGIGTDGLSLAAATGAAAATTTLLLYPLDVVKTRLTTGTDDVWEVVGRW